MSTAVDVSLRPFEQGDLALLEKGATEPSFSQPFEWSGFASRQALRRRWEEDGFLAQDPHYLVVSLADRTAVGYVMWRDPELFGRKGWVWEVGILLAPEHRGQGVGTTAQVLLARYLFETSLVHRLCAYTELGNLAEQRSLKKAGFRREGVLRHAGFREGKWRDVVIYGRLKDDELPA